MEGTMQGDNLAMSFYSVGTSILIYSNNTTRQIWLADDASAGGKLDQLKTCWENVIREGERLGYIVNKGKSWLILKDAGKVEYAKQLFDSSINITTEGKRHLGASVGSNKFTIQYMESKVNDWLNQLKNLNEIARAQPQVTYSAYIHGFQHKYTYFMRTIPNISTFLQPIEDFLTDTFIPTLFGSSISRTERELFSLSTRLGGLGISILTECSEDQYISSERITAPLVVSIIIFQSEKQHSGKELPDHQQTTEIIQEEKRKKQQTLTQKQVTIDEKLDQVTRRAVSLAREKGSSSWLQVLVLKEYNFCLNKSEFRDALNLRYGRVIEDLPSSCPCGQRFSPDHAMSCKKGGFVHTQGMTR